MQSCTGKRRECRINDTVGGECTIQCQDTIYKRERHYCYMHLSRVSNKHKMEQNKVWSEAEILGGRYEHVRKTSYVHVRHFWHGKLVIEELE